MYKETLDENFVPSEISLGAWNNQIISNEAAFCWHAINISTYSYITQKERILYIKDFDCVNRVHCLQQGKKSGSHSGCWQLMDCRGTNYTHITIRPNYQQHWAHWGIRLFKKKSLIRLQREEAAASGCIMYM